LVQPVQRDEVISDLAAPRYSSRCQASRNQKTGRQSAYRGEPEPSIGAGLQPARASLVCPADEGLWVP
jgi:hypothetical protein